MCVCVCVCVCVCACMRACVRACMCVLGEERVDGRREGMWEGKVEDEWREGRRRMVGRVRGQEGRKCDGRGDVTTLSYLNNICHMKFCISCEQAYVLYVCLKAMRCTGVYGCDCEWYS